VEQEAEEEEVEEETASLWITHPLDPKEV